MVSFKVKFEMFVQAVFLQKCNRCSCIKIILVFGRLFRFWLDQKLTREADFLRILYSHMEESGEVIKFKAHIRIQQGFVAFTTAPEYIVFCTQLDCCFQAFFHLCCSISKHVRIGSCCCTMHITWVREHVSRIPQQFNACILHALFKLCNDDIQILVGFLQCSTFRSYVYIMEAVIRSTQLLKEFEVNFYASLGKIKPGYSFPRTNHVTLSKRIASVHS
ncbi:hypothetical protein D3C78_1201990 [compost metagenome]